MNCFHGVFSTGFITQLWIRIIITIKCNRTFLEERSEIGSPPLPKNSSIRLQLFEQYCGRNRQILVITIPHFPAEEIITK